jgi:hypothetical protein
MIIFYIGIGVILVASKSLSKFTILSNYVLNYSSRLYNELLKSNFCNIIRNIFLSSDRCFMVVGR